MDRLTSYLPRELTTRIRATLSEREPDTLEVLFDERHRPAPRRIYRRKSYSRFSEK